MRWTKWRILLVTAVILVLAAFVAWTLWNAVEGARLRKALASIKDAGWPTTVAELRRPPVPDDQNAAPLLNQAFLLMRGGKPDGANLTPAIAELSAYVPRGDRATQNLTRADAAECAALRAKMDEVPEILSLLQQAAARPACDFELRYEEGISLRLPHVSASRAAVKLLGLRAWLEARAGRGEAAAAALRDALRLAAHAGEDGFLISLLVSVTGEQTALEYVQAALSLPGGGGLDAAGLRALREEVDRRRQGVRAVVSRAFDFERVGLGGWCFEGVLSGRVNLRDLGQTETPPFLYSVGGISRPILKADYRAYLEAMNTYRRALEQPRPDQVYDEKKFFEGIPRTAILTHMALPALGKVLQKTVEHEALLDAARLGLAAEEHRRATGAYPARLEDQTLVQPVPADPFTGAAFRYVVSTNGCCVYSLGPDGKDQGGKERSGTSREGDIAWRVERP